MTSDRLAAVVPAALVRCLPGALRPRAAAIHVPKLPGRGAVPFATEHDSVVGSEEGQRVMRRDLPGEEWRPVVGWEGDYEVSNLGRVWSCPVGTPRTGRILRHAVNPGGYPSVTLSRRGKVKTRPIHQLVLAAFAGPRPAGKDVIRHLDGDPTNNLLGNLAYGTQSENAQDSLRHGTHPKASKIKCPQGHPYAGDNLLINAVGGRVCRACAQARRAEKVSCPDCAQPIVKRHLSVHRQRKHGEWVAA